MASETKKSRTSRRFRVIAGSTAAVMIGSGVAIAFWTTTGAGKGTATAGALEKIEIVQDGAIEFLYPVKSPAKGDPALLDVKVTVTNPATSTAVATIETIAAKVVGVNPSAPVPPGDADGCPTDEFVVTPEPFAPFTLAPGATSAPVTVATIYLEDTGVNQNACQNATIDLEFTSP